MAPFYFFVNLKTKLGQVEVQVEDINYVIYEGPLECLPSRKRKNSVTLLVIDVESIDRIAHASGQRVHVENRGFADPDRT